MQSNLWNVFDSCLGHKPHSCTIIEFFVTLGIVLKIKMHPSQKQHSSVYMKIVKYELFKPVKDTLGFGQLCAVMGVTFGQQQCDCFY